MGWSAAFAPELGYKGGKEASPAHQVAAEKVIVGGRSLKLFNHVLLV